MNTSIKIHHHWCDFYNVWHNYISIKGPQLSSAAIHHHVQQLNNAKKFLNVTCIALREKGGEELEIILRRCSMYASFSKSTRSRRFQIVGRIEPSVSQMGNEPLTITSSTSDGEQPNALQRLLREDGKIIISQYTTSGKDGFISGYLICNTEHTIGHIMKPLQTYLRVSGFTALADKIVLKIEKTQSKINDTRESIIQICTQNYKYFWQKQVDEGVITVDEMTIKNETRCAKLIHDRLHHPRTSPQTERCTKKQLEERIDEAVLEYEIWKAIDQARMGTITEEKKRNTIDHQMGKFTKRHGKGIGQRRFIQFWDYQRKAVLK